METGLASPIIVGSRLRKGPTDSARGAAKFVSDALASVKRLRKRTGIDFDPHWFRHTAATRMLRGAVPLEVASKLLGHASVITTADTYGHLTSEDACRVLEKAGWFTGTEVRLRPGRARPSSPRQESRGCWRN